MERAQLANPGVEVMLYFDLDGLINVRAAEAQLEKLERLANDLRDLINRTPPSKEILEAAPTISNWRLAEEPVSILVGEVIGHPELPGHRLIATSPIAVIGARFGWVRTNSRYYGLGEPFDPSSDVN